MSLGAEGAAPFSTDECRCPACQAPAAQSLHPLQAITDAPCDPASCANGKCSATGQCVDRLPALERAPPLAPDDNVFRYLSDAAMPRVPTDAVMSLNLRTASEIEAERLAAKRAPARRFVIGFTGLAGSGKSTAAAHMVNEHGFTRVRFAGPLKDMMRALGLTEAEIEGDRKEVPCALLGGRTPRYAMQTIGTEWGRNIIAQDLWIRAWQADVDKLPVGAPVVVDDCRFPNEAEAVRRNGGALVRIVRPGAGQGAAGHSSEGQALGERITIRNDTNFAGLYDQLSDLLASRFRA